MEQLWAGFLFIRHSIFENSCGWQIQPQLRELWLKK